MANQVSIINDGYVQSVGFLHPAVAGPVGLAAKGSYRLFGVCSDYSGNIFVSDPAFHIILKITPSGNTYTYGGRTATSGNNGATPVRQSASRFNTPRGMACDAYGNLFVADSGNNQIRKITPDGWVTLVAGDPNGVAGYVNGTSAKFSAPWDVAVDTSNNMYIADYTNNCIRFVRNGLQSVCTISGTNVAGDVYGAGATARYRNPRSIAVDQGGMCYIADYGNYKIKRMNQDGFAYKFSGTGVKGTTAGIATVARFQDLFMVTTDRSGNVYAIDYTEAIGARLLRVTADGFVNVEYNFKVVSTQPLVCGIDVNRSGKLFIIESTFEDAFYSSSSSSSIDSHSSNSSSSGSRSSNSSFSHSSDSSSST